MDMITIDQKQRTTLLIALRLLQQTTQGVMWVKQHFPDLVNAANYAPSPADVDALCEEINMPQGEPAIYLAGNISEGFTCIGPFPGFEAAAAFNEGVPGWIMVCKNPNPKNADGLLIGLRSSPSSSGTGSSPASHTVDSELLELAREVVESADDTGCDGDLTVATASAVEALGEHLRTRALVGTDLQGLISEVEEHLQESDLDDLVHDAVSSHGSQVNNGGIEAQVKLIVEQLGLTQATKSIMDIIREKQS